MVGSTRLALLITLAAVLTIAAVWAFERAGYTPCELCLLERKPFYASLPVGLVTAYAAHTGWWRTTRLLFAVLIVVFAISAGIAAYHAGVEWNFWAGPSGCSGAVQVTPKVEDFLKQLDTVKVVRCDQAALRVFGLSLAGWNVLASLFLVVVAAIGLRGATLSLLQRR